MQNARPEPFLIKQLILITVFLSLITTSYDLYACSCGHPEPKEYIKGSLIFFGKVISVNNLETYTKKDKGVVVASFYSDQATFKVIRSYKGEEQNYITVKYSRRDGVGCGWEFKEGQEVMVFAGGDQRKGYKTGMCSMIPYASAKNQGDDRFDIALEKYRLRKSSLLKKPQTTKSLREQIGFFVEYNDFPFAEKAYTNLLKKIPKDIPALIGRAKLRYDLERYEEALADYKTALSVKSDDKDARRGRILSLVKLGRINELTPSDNDFTGIEISGYENTLTFAGAKLAGASFINSNLSSLNFTGADLRKADFSGADLNRCDFTDANLAGANFDNLKQTYMVNFTNANLRQSSFKNAYLRYSKFEGANLDHVDFSKAKLEQNNSFENAILETVNFQGTKLILNNFRGSRWQGQDLSGVEIWGSDLRDAVLQNVSLRKAVFKDSFMAEDIMDLRGTDLSKADLTDVTWGFALFDCKTKLPSSVDISSLPLIPLWSKCNGNPPKTKMIAGFKSHEGPRFIKIDGQNSQFSNMNLSGYGFWESKFDGSDFSKADLVNIDIQGSSFTHTNFEGVQLENCYFSRVDFRNSSFNNANLSNCRIHDVDFREANFDGIKLFGSTYDKKTIWPDGFDLGPTGAKADPYR
jgi:uncharacterized protein YjbI with pentapeptide repeats